VFELLASMKNAEPRVAIGRMIGETEDFTKGVLRDDLALFALRRLESEAETEPGQELQV
jgi:hypothetical protein